MQVCAARGGSKVGAGTEPLQHCQIQDPSWQYQMRPSRQVGHCAAGTWPLFRGAFAIIIYPVIN